MNTDWDSDKEDLVEYTSGSSLHIPINPESKIEYDLWLDSKCDDLWWYWKNKIREGKI